MRILRLDLGEGIGTVDLHPFISVLHHLDETQIDTLLRSIRSLVNGSGADVRGLVESGGNLIELEQAGQLGPLTTEDVVIDVDGLLGAGSDPEVRERELAELTRRAEIDAVMLEEIRADLDPSIAAKVYRLRKRLGLIGAEERALKRAQLVRVDEAVAAVRALPATFTEVPEEIQGLISLWEQYVADRAVAGEQIVKLEQRVQRAESGLADAQKNLAAARKKAAPLMLTPAEDARLEELVNPTDKKRRHKGLSGEDEAEMAALLAKVRQPTYTAYAMYRLSPTPVEEHLAELTAAEEACAAAQAEAEAARSELANDELVNGLEGQFEEVKAEARQHLGPMLPPDLGKALAELVIEVENPEWLDALRVLYEQLLSDDIIVPDDIEPEGLVAFAEEWADETRIDLTIEEVEDSEVLEAELLEAEATFNRHAVAINRIERLEARAAGSARRVQELQARPLGEPGGGLSALADHLGAMAMRLRGQNAASVPMLLVGDFEPLGERELDGLMGQLEGLAQHHQLIIASDRDQIASWAMNAGLRRALSSTPTRTARS